MILMSVYFSPTGDADSHEGALQPLVPTSALLHQHIAYRNTLSSSVRGDVSYRELLVNRSAHRDESYNILHDNQHSCQFNGAGMGFLYWRYYTN